MEVSIVGGREVVFHEHVVPSGPAHSLWRLAVEGARTIAFHKHTLHNAELTNLQIHLADCHFLHLHSKAFDNKVSPQTLLYYSAGAGPQTYVREPACPQTILDVFDAHKSILYFKWY